VDWVIIKDCSAEEDFADVCCTVWDKYVVKYEIFKVLNWI